jgi:hypothetical protein
LDHISQRSLCFPAIKNFCYAFLSQCHDVYDNNFKPF